MIVVLVSRMPVSKEPSLPIVARRYGLTLVPVLTGSGGGSGVLIEHRLAVRDVVLRVTQKGVDAVPSTGRLVLVPDAAHDLMVDAPDVLLSEIRRACREVDTNV